MSGCERLFLCQGGVSTIGFFALCFFVLSTIIIILKGGELGLRDYGIIILASVAVTVARIFVPFV